MMKYRQTFVVTGKSNFPLDMLRYDHCWPDTSEDAVKIGTDDPAIWAHPDSGVMAVFLSRHVSSPKDLPTEGRWNSFGWKIIPHSVRTMKL